MDKKNTGIIFDIKKYAIHDGPGIRTTVFFKGCPLRCWWCHNPEGINHEPEYAIKRFKGNNSPTIPKKEVIGREVNVAEVMKEIVKDWIFYEQSGDGGVTFSGGEPLMQPEFLHNLLISCREHEIMTTLDTSGYTTEKILGKIMNQVDLFLYDIKILDPQKHQYYTGVSNELINSNLKKLDEEGKSTIVRFPVIPGITDTNQNIGQLVEWLSTLDTINEIHLLPFHNIAKGKYEMLNRENRLKDLEPPNPEKVGELVEAFQSIGFKVRIGG